jgi:hypothetical protein
MIYIRNIIWNLSNYSTTSRVGGDMGAATCHVMSSRHHLAFIFTPKHVLFIWQMKGIDGTKIPFGFVRFEMNCPIQLDWMGLYDVLLFEQALPIQTIPIPNMSHARVSRISNESHISLHAPGFGPPTTRRRRL